MIQPLCFFLSEKKTQTIHICSFDCLERNVSESVCDVALHPAVILVTATPNTEKNARAAARLGRFSASRNDAL